ncbi:MAG: ion channel [Methanobacteriaceae archaeon]|nr:ion channel [Methanobacteriaceae archaeon]
MNRRIEIFLEILFISVIFIDAFLLLTSSLMPFRAGNFQNIAYVDLFASLILLLAYINQMRKNDPKIYLKKNWNFLIVVIPFSFIAINILGFSPDLFILKLLNLVKAIALVFAIRQVGKNVDNFVEKSRLVYGVSFFIAILLTSSIAFYLAENGINPNVTNYEDSIWYVIQTITTVGYGDIVPYTQFGRLIGVIAMISAIGITSLLTAATTSSLLDKVRQESDKLSKRNAVFMKNLEKKIDKISEEVADRKDIDVLNQELKKLKSEIIELKEIIEKK